MRPRIADIITIASRLSETTASEICGPRRYLHLCAIRYAIYKTARDWGYSFPQIGHSFNRDHASIIHIYNNAHRFSSYIEEFDEFCAAVDRFSDELPPFVADTNWQPDRKFCVVLTRMAQSARAKVARQLHARRKAQIAERLGLTVTEFEPEDIEELKEIDGIERADQRQAVILQKTTESFVARLRAAA